MKKGPKPHLKGQTLLRGYPQMLEVVREDKELEIHFIKGDANFCTDMVLFDYNFLYTP